jgi:hypothetical protein
MTEVFPHVRSNTLHFTVLIGSEIKDHVSRGFQDF